MALGTPLPLLLSTVGDYEIERSLRFNDDDSAYLNRTLAAGTQTKWTFSCWIKLGNIKNSFHAIFSGFTGSSDQYNMIGLDGSNRVIFATQDEGSGGVMNVISNATLRDPNAFYHIVTTYDSAQSTASDRVKGYINGVQCTSFSTASYPSSSKASYINSNNQHNIGKRWMAAYYDGYIAEVHFCDNQAYTASAFGETNEDTGQWVPKKFAGSYGTNGFKLNFSDNSGTTATTLGKDSSGNGNNFTPNNFSVAAGIGNDSTEDTPTNNWCTLNPIDNGGVTLTQGNLVANTSAGFDLVRSTFFLSSGKWYWEVTCDDVGATFVGVSDNLELLTGRGAQTTATSCMVRTTTGGKYINGTESSYAGAAITDGEVMMFALDMDNGKFWAGKSGTWFNSGNPAAGSNEATSALTNPVSPSVSLYDNEDVTFNFGSQKAFAHTPPTGFKKINTANLPEPTIEKSTDHFNTVLYTGNDAASHAITGVGFQPDLVWIKARSAAYDYRVYDDIRGVNAALLTDTTAAEDQYAGYGQFKSFDSDGFTVGNGTTAGHGTNTNSVTHAAFNWKESATAGFDIVSYTGNGSARTISHSLGVAPEMMIVKRRDGADNWMVYHKDNGNTHYLELNAAGGKIDNTIWNDTTPTSSVFSLGTDGSVNASSATYIAYLWASVKGYSKVGSFVGNGNADRPFMYTGFRPAWVYSKGGSHNLIWHNEVEGYNPTKKAFLTNANNAEEALDGWSLDFYSNGFKMRGTDANANESGTTFVYLAMAESPFKYSNAR